MNEYLFNFEGTSILLRAENDTKAERLAFHAVCADLSLDARRLNSINWPSDSDYERIDLNHPLILEE